VEALQKSLAEESRQRKLIEQRFFVLAQNHEEMIRLKDEYKGEAHRLQQELLSGKREHENGAKRSLELEKEVDRIKCQWQEKLRGMERRVALVEEQRDMAEKRASQLEHKMQSAAGDHLGMMQSSQASLKSQCGVWRGW
jgi:hypothetical protein